MAAFAYRIQSAHLGTLANGRKIVQSVIVFTSTGTDIADVPIGGSLANQSTSATGALTEIIDFTIGWGTAGAQASIQKSATRGAISIQPIASLNGKQLNIIAVGV